MPYCQFFRWILQYPGGIYSRMLLIMSTIYACVRAFIYIYIYILYLFMATECTTQYTTECTTQYATQCTTIRIISGFHALHFILFYV
nr:MAG TPA: hypothetical protein [Caudoviricetes sp.]